MGRAEGKVVLITGAASGLGKADAQRLAEEGAKLILTDINRAEGPRDSCLWAFGGESQIPTGRRLPRVPFEPSELAHHSAKFAEVI